MKTREIKLKSTLTSTLALAFFIGTVAVVVAGLIAPETAYAKGKQDGACKGFQTVVIGGPNDYEGVEMMPGSAAEDMECEENEPAGITTLPVASGRKKVPLRTTTPRKIGIVQSQTVKKARPQKKILKRGLVSRPIKKK